VLATVDAGDESTNHEKFGHAERDAEHTHRCTEYCRDIRHQHRPLPIHSHEAIEDSRHMGSHCETTIHTGWRIRCYQPPGRGDIPIFTAPSISGILDTNTDLFLYTASRQLQVADSASQQTLTRQDKCNNKFHPTCRARSQQHQVVPGC